MKKNNEPFVSVLTPVYNGATYLRECIESVLAQEYSNWEYVLVNNCSTDNSLEIIKEYAELDSRIRIHDNGEFLQQMQNLNHAFRQISPDSIYCKVLHADDWLYPECITRMVEVAEMYPTVGIVSSYRLDDTRVGLNGLPYPSHFNDGREISRRYLLNNEYYFGAPSNLLLRSDLIRKRGRVYDESYPESDISACLDFLQESDFGFVHQVLTFTRRHEESHTHTLAKRNYHFMMGYLKMYLEYGPVFLSEREHKKQIALQTSIFHKLLARALYEGNGLQTYKKYASELDEVGLKIRNARLALYVIRELFVRLLATMGVEMINVKRRKKVGNHVQIAISDELGS
ncbi:glycosyltransferase family 2 protein [Rhodohalobacter mucosus]|uniref:Glycosyltransferase family 2 protein n=2 Tax=Rhodohalobacter mucosus TaxID=2079485 RepID=A0A316TYW6_9BACT|nr:glycosyltransferase family 2 protein [Rhodohalobacter mucosus]